MLQTNQTISVAADKDFFETIERTSINPPTPEEPDTSTKYSPGMNNMINFLRIPSKRSFLNNVKTDSHIFPI